MALTIKKTSKVEKTIELVRDAANYIAEAGAQRAYATAVVWIVGQKGGGIKYSTLPQRSSSPGQKPVYQFGDLVASLKFSPSEESLGYPCWEFTSDSEVAYWLEHGTPRMAPRPFLTEASVVGGAAMESFGKEVSAILRTI